MVAWEYTVRWMTANVDVPSGDTSVGASERAFDEGLNRLGAAGWQVFAVVPGLIAPTNNGWFVLSRRRRGWFAGYRRQAVRHAGHKS